MILWPPSAAELLEPYPPGHALERRLRFPLIGPRPADEELAARIEAEALAVELEPGDAIFFPAGWTHHTEAVECGPRDGGEQGEGSWTDGLSVSLGLRIC
jgi:hypothetical protein